MEALGPIKFLTFHCSATPDGRDVKAAEISAWDTAKFGQASYHWVIELDGTMVRTLSDNLLGAHVHMHNHFNVGACYVGGCDIHMQPKDTRTPKQMASMAALVSHYRGLANPLKILGHHDWPLVAKACPSFDVGAWISAGMPVA